MSKYQHLDTSRKSSTNFRVKIPLSADINSILQTQQVFQASKCDNDLDRKLGGFVADMFVNDDQLDYEPNTDVEEDRMGENGSVDNQQYLKDGNENVESRDKLHCSNNRVGQKTFSFRNDYTRNVKSSEVYFDSCEEGDEDIEEFDNNLDSAIESPSDNELDNDQVNNSETVQDENVSHRATKNRVQPGYTNTSPYDNESYSDQLNSSEAIQDENVSRRATKHRVQPCDYTNASPYDSESYNDQLNSSEAIQNENVFRRSTKNRVQPCASPYDNESYNDQLNSSEGIQGENVFRRATKNRVQPGGYTNSSPYDDEPYNYQLNSSEAIQDYNVSQRATKNRVQPCGYKNASPYDNESYNDQLNSSEAIQYENVFRRATNNRVQPCASPYDNEAYNDQLNNSEAIQNENVFRRATKRRVQSCASPYDNEAYNDQLNNSEAIPDENVFRRATKRRVQSCGYTTASPYDNESYNGHLNSSEAIQNENVFRRATKNRVQPCVSPYDSKSYNDQLNNSEAIQDENVFRRATKHCVQTCGYTNASPYNNESYNDQLNSSEAIKNENVFRRATKNRVQSGDYTNPSPYDNESYNDQVNSSEAIQDENVFREASKNGVQLCGYTNASPYDNESYNDQLNSSEAIQDENDFRRATKNRVQSRDYASASPYGNEPYNDQLNTSEAIQDENVFRGATKDHVQPCDYRSAGTLSEQLPSTSAIKQIATCAPKRKRRKTFLITLSGNSRSSTLKVNVFRPWSTTIEDELGGNVVRLTSLDNVIRYIPPPAIEISRETLSSTPPAHVQVGAPIFKCPLSRPPRQKLLSKIIPVSGECSAQTAVKLFQRNLCSTAVNPAERNLRSTLTAGKSVERNVCTTQTAVNPAERNLRLTITAGKSVEKNVCTTQTSVNPAERNLCSTQTTVNPTQRKLCSTRTAGKSVERNLCSTRTAVDPAERNSRSTPPGKSVERNVCTTQTAVNPAKRNFRSTITAGKSVERNVCTTQTTVNPAEINLWSSHTAGISAESNLCSTETTVNPAQKKLCSTRNAGKFVERNLCSPRTAVDPGERNSRSTQTAGNSVERNLRSTRTAVKSVRRNLHSTQTADINLEIATDDIISLIASTVIDEDRDNNSVACPEPPVSISTRVVKQFRLSDWLKQDCPIKKNIPYDSIPNVYKGLCYDFFFHEGCRRGSWCYHSHTLFHTNSRLNKLIYLDQSALKEAYSFAQTFPLFYKQVYKHFVNVFAKKDMKPEILSVVPIILEDSIYDFDKVEGLTTVLLALMETDLENFPDAVEYLLLKFGIKEYPMLGSLLFQHICNQRNMVSCWPVVKRLVLIGEKMSPGDGEKFLRNLLDHPENGEIYKLVYNLFKKYQFLELSKIDPIVAKKFETICTSSRPNESTTPSNGQSIVNQAAVRATETPQSNHQDNELQFPRHIQNNFSVPPPNVTRSLPISETSFRSTDLYEFGYKLQDAQDFASLLLRRQDQNNQNLFERPTHNQPAQDLVSSKFAGQTYRDGNAAYRAPEVDNDYERLNRNRAVSNRAIENGVINNRVVTSDGESSQVDFLTWHYSDSDSLEHNPVRHPADRAQEGQKRVYNHEGSHYDPEKDYAPAVKRSNNVMNQYRNNSSECLNANKTDSSNKLYKNNRMGDFTSDTKKTVNNPQQRKCQQPQPSSSGSVSLNGSDTDFISHDVDMRPEYPQFGKLNLHPNYIFNVSLHNSYLEPIQTIDIDEGDVWTLNSCIKTVNGAAFLKMIDKYRPPSTVQNFISMTIAHLRQVKRIDITYRKLLENIEKVHPRFYNQLSLKVVLEVITFNVLFELEEKRFFRAARELLLTFRDWDSLVTSRVFIHRDLSIIGRYLFIANLFVEVKPELTYEILVCPRFLLLEENSLWPYYVNDRHVKADYAMRDKVLRTFFTKSYLLNSQVVLQLHKTAVKKQIWNYHGTVFINDTVVDFINKMLQPSIKQILTDFDLFSIYLSRNTIRGFLICVSGYANHRQIFKIFDQCVERGLYQMFYRGQIMEDYVTIKTNMLNQEIDIIIRYYFYHMRRLNSFLRGASHLRFSIRLAGRLDENDITMLNINRSVTDINQTVQNILKNTWSLKSVTSTETFVEVDKIELMNCLPRISVQ